MSLMENVSAVYGAEDGQRVEAIAKLLLSQMYGRELANPERTSMRALAHKGDNPRAEHCVRVAAVIVNYLKEEGL